MVRNPKICGGGIKQCGVQVTPVEIMERFDYGQNRYHKKTAGKKLPGKQKGLQKKKKTNPQGNSQDPAKRQAVNDLKT